MIVRRVLSAGLLAALTTASVNACGAQQDPRSTRPPAQQPTESTQQADAPTAGSPAAGVPALAITDPWVKATKRGMTAAFGTLVNNTDADVTVVSGTSPSRRRSSCTRSSAPATRRSCVPRRAASSSPPTAPVGSSPAATTSC
ncbi:hypothetical protein ACFQX6_02210 [Streptosporangium lutulentum]